MKQRNLVTVILMHILVGYGLSLAQEVGEKKPGYGWKKEAIGNLNLTQAGFDNWVSGGENMLAWQLGINVNLTLDQEKYSWSNTAKLSYGQAKIGDSDARKSADEIRLESIAAYKLGWYVDPFASTLAQTQSAAGYDYGANTKTEISNFLDPGYFTLSVGGIYAPSDEIKTRLGGALKITVTNEFPRPYADDPNTPEMEKTKSEGGVMSVTDLKLKLDNDILFTSRLDLFSNLKSLDQVVVRWDNLMLAKVSKYFNVSLNVELFYDKSISSKRQLREVLALGVLYSFL